jgi:hypothetical protein
LHLSSTPADSKIELVETIRTSSIGGKRTQTLQLDIDTTIDVTAKGGDGGRGGVGGNGGNGDRGSKGRVSLNNVVISITHFLVLHSYARSVIRTLHDTSLGGMGAQGAMEVMQATAAAAPMVVRVAPLTGT